MRLLIAIIFSAAGVLGCGEKAKQPIPTPPEKQEDAFINDENLEPSNPDWNTEGFSVTDTCTFDDKENCDELRVTIKAADAKTGDRVSSSFDGRAGEQIGLAFTAEAKSSKYEDGVNDSERVALGFRQIPSDADTESEGAKAALLWKPRAITSGSIEVVFRDIGRCIVEEAYSKKGKLDEDKAEDCEDLKKTGFSKYEETKKFSYRIEKGKLQTAKEAALNALDAQCKAEMLSSMIGAVPGLLGGSTAGVLTAGVGGFTSHLQCQAQKEQIEAQFGTEE